MSKVFNFSAGPAMIFPEVLHKAQAELTNWLGQGVSVMEVSHRGKYFMELITQAEKRSARKCITFQIIIACYSYKVAHVVNLQPYR